MVDETDPKVVWRGIGRGLDRHYPPQSDDADAIDRLVEALKRRDKKSGGNLNFGV